MPQEPAYREAAAVLGTEIGRAGAELVYGGGRIGLMGLVADAALAAGAKVIGVIPAALHNREIAHPGLSDLVVVPDMQERKREMFALSDAVAVLPGGLGTLDELFEVWTTGTLGVHAKPVVLLDVDGFYSGLTEWLAGLSAQNFMHGNAMRSLHVVPTVAQAFAVIEGAIGG